MSKLSLLSKNTNATLTDGGGRHIVCISGGISSAWVAWWVKNNIDGEIIYYFNDVKWEHEDLYRFLDDIERVLEIEIFRDNDGRTPEQVFYDNRMLGSNRTPICSRVMKAERLQKFIKNGDTAYFGIDVSETRRAARITPIYARLGANCEFPIIDNIIQKEEMTAKIIELGIKIPKLYIDGFKHNNCSGGCVRAGAKQWMALLGRYPDVYAERERVEVEFNEKIKPKTYATFMKEMSLTELREAVEKQFVFNFDSEDDYTGECIGICGSMN